MSFFLICFLTGNSLTSEFSSEITPAIFYLSSSPYIPELRDAKREIESRLNYSYYQFYPYEDYNYTPSLLCSFKTKKGKINLIIRVGIYPKTKKTSSIFFLLGIGGLYPLSSILSLNMDYTKPLNVEFLPQDPNFNFKYRHIDILSPGITLSKSILYITPQLHLARASGTFRKDIEHWEEDFSEYLWYGSIRTGLRWGRFNIETTWTGRRWGGGIGVHHKI